MSRSTLRDALDEWHPTVVRYCGIGLVIYEALSGLERPSLLVAAAGMIGYKSIIDWHRNGKNGEE